MDAQREGKKNAVTDRNPAQSQPCLSSESRALKTTALRGPSRFGIATQSTVWRVSGMWAAGWSRQQW